MRKTAVVPLLRVWTFPLWWAASTAPNASDTVADVARFVDMMDRPDLVPLSPRDRFAYLAGLMPEFRAVVHYRLRSRSLIPRTVLRFLYRPYSLMIVEADSIGPGLFIQHGFCTMFSAHTIGKNFSISQNTSVGYTAKGRPTIGDNVTVCAGAVVAGPIHIGDNVMIGANATVMKDVPAGATMVAPLATQLGGSSVGRD